MSNFYSEPFVMYEVGISALELRFRDGSSLDVSATLENGRGSYLLFETLVGLFAGLSAGSQGGLSDLVDAAGLGHEVKSYRDPESASPGKDLFHTAASSTFGPNNHGPRIASLLRDGHYDDALALCVQSGYSKNAYYIYTNTGGYKPSLPFRYFIVPTASVLECLSAADPRLVSRSALLRLLGRTERIK